MVGSQAGKSGGSVLQQVLLLVSGGAIAGILPVMAICYFAMAQVRCCAVVGELTRLLQTGHSQVQPCIVLQGSGCTPSTPYVRCVVVRRVGSRP